MKILQNLSLLFITIFLSAPGYSQTVDTISIYSPSMNKQVKNIIILPASYGTQPQQKYPVVYLLHGHGGDYTTWLKLTKPDLAKVISDAEVIAICPDGQNSWYWDSPIRPDSQYETYVSRELTGYIDSHYQTLDSRKGRAVTGFSMGGHGGLWLGFRHPDIFGACGSMSGGLDIRPFPNNWNMKDQLGTYTENQKRWDEHTVINQLPYNKEYGTLSIIIDCGTDDFFYEVNQKLHEKLLSMAIPHDYIIRPGIHTHTYWNNAADYQLLFFRKFFNQ